METEQRIESPYALVMVEWQDSRVLVGGWQWIDELTEPRATRCISVGWLLAETDDTIAIAQNLGDVFMLRAQVSGITEIAKRQIIQRKDFIASHTGALIAGGDHGS